MRCGRRRIYRREGRSGLFGGSSEVGWALDGAEVVLIKAEALARLNQLAAAVAEYNKVRVRAGLAPHVLGVNVTTQADVLAAIEKERRLELALEGDRWPDLVRLGEATTVRGIPAWRTVFPIPASDVAAAGLTQNPNY